VSHTGGTLYKAKKCAKHDTRLSWNKVGPQGPPGANGAPGGSIWAGVRPDGTVYASSSSWGSNTVTHLGMGRYCVSQPAFWATPEYNTGGDPVVASSLGGSTACPSGQLFLQDTKTGSLVDDTFLIFLAP
jgi:hypothetical protein